MKTITFVKPLLLVLSLFLLSFDLEQQLTVPEEIYSAIRAGNSKVLAKYFNSNVELVILDKEGVYSKTQAEYIIREFFAKNMPTSLVKRHEGKSGKEASKYVICTLSTSKGQYRVYFVMKNNNGEFTIHQFRIENDNN
ncbi:MAG TPA: DUF4783 domain-containing protein [Bacteroidales bacterium]